MVIKNISLLGAGAIGAYFIDGLEACPDVNFSIIASGNRYDRLKKDGITINGTKHMLNLKKPEEITECDLLLITTKYDGLKTALDDIKKVVKANTTVLSLLNGIDSEEIVGEAVGFEHMVYSVMRISSHRQGSSINYNPAVTYGFTFGEKDTREMTERCKAIDDIFNKTNINHHFLPDIMSDLWKKFANNISNNLPQAVLDVPFGAYYDSEHLAYISKKLDSEVRAVAAKYNISFGDSSNSRDACPPQTIFSTLQDIRAKRHTEVDMFFLVLKKKADAVGVSVPFAEYTYHAIKTIEEKNDGRFDY